MEEYSYSDIKKLYLDLISNYKDGDYIDVETFQNKYEFFSLDYNYDFQKYIFEKKKIDNFLAMYDKLNNYNCNSFSYKIVKYGVNSRIYIYVDEIEEEIALYGPSTKFISIKKKYLDYFNKIRKDVFSLLIIEHESWFEIKSHNN